MNKKGQALNLNSLLTVGITLVVVGIALAFGIQVLGDTKDDIGADNCAVRTDDFTGYSTTADQCANASNSTQYTAVGTAEFNATGDAISGTGKLTSKMPTIGLVVAAVIIIGLLVSAFAFRQ